MAQVSNELLNRFITEAGLNDVVNRSDGGSTVTPARASNAQISNSNNTSTNASGSIGPRDGNENGY